MVISGWHINLNIWLRWIHVLAALLWIGQLYSLDFIYAPLYRLLDLSDRDSPVPKLILRALWWFRWGAMISFLSGISLFVLNYLYIQGVGFGASALFVDDQGITERATWILFGMAAAMVMWFNTWFVIWPGQKKVLKHIGAPSDQDSYLLRRSLRGLRTNTFLSGPMLFAMLAPAHYGSINFQTWLLVVAIAGAVAGCLVAISQKTSSQ